METIAATTERERSHDAVEVDDFLRSLQIEQERFLEHLGRATATLQFTSPQLAAAGAVHTRLTRRWFDAQRAIIAHRAQVSRQVAMGLTDDDCSDIASMTRIIDGALRPDDVDGARYERQLGDLLDSWWRAEQDDASTSADDAHTRVGARKHDATARTPGRVEGALPAAIAARLASADGSSVGAVVESLLTTLDAGRSAGVADGTLPPSRGDDLSIVDDGRGWLAADHDPFQQFWSAAEPIDPPVLHLAGRRFAWRRLVQQVVLPITVVTLAFSAVMAWIG